VFFILASDCDNVSQWAEGLRLLASSPSPTWKTCRKCLAVGVESGSEVDGYQEERSPML